MDLETYQLGKKLYSFNYQKEQEGILAILEKGHNVILDMTACQYVSSMGLRVLLYSKKIAASKGLNVYLVGVNDEVKDIMSITGFEDFFDSFNTVEECLEKLNS